MQEHAKFGDRNKGLFSFGKWAHHTCGGDCCFKTSSHGSPLHSRCLASAETHDLVCECNHYVVTSEGTSGKSAKKALAKKVMKPAGNQSAAQTPNRQVLFKELLDFNLYHYPPYFAQPHLVRGPLVLDSDIINEQGKIQPQGSPLHTDSTEEPTPQGPFSRHKGFKFHDHDPHDAHDTDPKPTKPVKPS